MCELAVNDSPGIVMVDPYVRPSLAVVFHPEQSYH